MTVFGDLWVSTLSEPRPAGPTTTHVVPVDEKPHFLDRWQRAKEEVGKVTRSTSSVRA